MILEKSDFLPRVQNYLALFSCIFFSLGASCLFLFLVSSFSRIIACHHHYHFCCPQLLKEKSLGSPRTFSTVPYPRTNSLHFASPRSLTHLSFRSSVFSFNAHHSAGTLSLASVGHQNIIRLSTSALVDINTISVALKFSSFHLVSQLLASYSFLYNPLFFFCLAYLP